MLVHRTVCLLALVIGISGFSAFGATNYVSASGADTNPGTSTQPWKTMQKAANTAAAGDTVVVRPAVYDERVTISRPGITFQAEGNVTNRSTFVVQASNTRVDGFHITCDGSNTVYSTAFLMTFNPITNVWVVNNRIHDTPEVHPRGVIHFDTSSYTNATRAFIISNNTVYNFGGPMVSINGIGHLVVNNWMSNSWGADCFHVQGRDHIFRGNYSTQIGVGLANIWGAGNTSFNGPYFDDTRRRLASDPPYLMWTNSSGYNLVKSDAIWRIQGWSNVVNVVDTAHKKIYASAPRLSGPWTMHDPVVVSAPKGGIGTLDHPDYVEAIGPLVYPLPPSWGRSASNIVFESNWIVNCPGGSIVMFGANYTNVPGPVVDWTFRNNVWAWVEVSGGTSTPFTKYHNNTFYQCVTNGGPVLAFGLYHTNYYDPRGIALYCQVKSNAFVGCGKGDGAGWYGATAIGDWSTNAYPGFPMDTVLTNCDYNYVGELDGKAKSKGTGYPSPNRFAFSEPHGVNGGAVNFINPQALDFQVGAGSVLTNGGVRIGADMHLDRVDRMQPPARLRVIGSD